MGAVDEGRTIALELIRASGWGLSKGRLLLPTARLTWLARRALTKAKMIESLEMVTGNDEVRLNLVMKLMGNATRASVRASVSSLHVNRHGGALKLRLLETPTFAGMTGGKGGGLLGMMGAFGGAALASMGPKKILQSIAELLGPPLSAKGDVLILDLGRIPAVKQLVCTPTPFGLLGDLVHVVGARFQPLGLEVVFQVRPRAALHQMQSHITHLREWVGRLSP
ncbi:MAG: hypothetical protein NVSMB1_22300 [Polyangiales bacterium]